MPQTGSISNPLDLTFAKNVTDYFSEIPKALLEEKNAAYLLFYFYTPSRRLRRMLRQAGVSPDHIAEQTATLVNFQSEAILRLIETHNRRFVGYTFQSVTGPAFKKAC